MTRHAGSRRRSVSASPASRSKQRVMVTLISTVLRSSIDTVAVPADSITEHGAGDAIDGSSDMSGMRRHDRDGCAVRCVPVLLGVPRLHSSRSTEARGLLCVLFIRGAPVSDRCRMIAARSVRTSAGVRSLPGDCWASLRCGRTLQAASLAQ